MPSADDANLSRPGLRVRSDHERRLRFVHLERCKILHFDAGGTVDENARRTVEAIESGELHGDRGSALPARGVNGVQRAVGLADDLRVGDGWKEQR